jgi:Xaa-Pro aminopeptidase
LDAHDEVDGLLLVRQESLEDYDLRYLTGFTGSSAFAVVTTQQALLLTDVRYVEQAAHECPGWCVRRHGRPATAALAAALQGAGVRRLAFEPAGLTVALWNELGAGLPDTALEPAAGTVTALRARKDAAEVAAIARACAIGDAAFAQLLPALRPGDRERDVARRLEELLYHHGADAIAFDSIVASGPNSALPHARPGLRLIAPGDLVVFDFGARVDGYCADITRTVVMGPASAEQRRLYDAVREIQAAAVAGVRAGVRGADLDAAAKRAMQTAGYGEYPTHSLGHGLGLAVHEGPFLRARSDELLAAGHVVTVEPGIYLPGFGGVRIEDTVVIEEQGCRVLTSTSRELVELDAKERS